MTHDDVVKTEVAPPLLTRAGVAGVVAFSLLVALAGGAAGKEAPFRKPAPAERHPAPVVLDIPVDDLDRGTPRRAVHGFLQKTGAGDFRRAAGYLDLRQVPPADVDTLGPQLARRLKIVLDQKFPIDVETLSDTAQGLLNDGLPPDAHPISRI